MKTGKSLLQTVPGSLSFALSVAMIWRRKGRVALAISGIGILVFLAKAQIGLMVGWTNTNTALIRHSGADLWVMARNTPAWDYGTAIPRQAVFQARSVHGVADAEALFMAWNTWQRPDGRKVNVELVGLDEKFWGGPWKMKSGNLSAIRRQDHVVVDELYLSLLGAHGVGGDFEMYGRRATIGAISEGIRTFTASPHIFTTIANAIEYDRRYGSNQITYVLVKCLPGVSLRTVQSSLRKEIDYAEVLTTREFARRTAAYWMIETGVGFTVVLTAILGLLVAALIASQTVMASTREALPNYATLRAIGFGRKPLVGMVLIQSIFLGVGGIGVGGGFFLWASIATARTPVPLEYTPVTLMGVSFAILIACIVSTAPALRLLFKLDPIAVFHA